MTDGRTSQLGLHAPHDPAPPTLRLWLLGGLQVTIGDRLVPATWRLRKSQSLVKLLALAPHHRLHRDQILELLWPELDPSAAVNNFHRTLHAARRALAPDQPALAASLLHLQGQVLALGTAEPLWVDVTAFEGAAAVAQRSDDPADCEAALALYRGDLLPEDCYEDWSAAPREALRETYRALLARLARMHEARGNDAGAIAALRRLIDAEPTHEDASLSLMRLYARLGQRQQVVRQYARLQAALRHELDSEPDPTTERAYQELLTSCAATMHQPRTTYRSGDRQRRHNLPIQLTSFLGRENDVAEVVRCIAMHRLVTLAGPAGCGKTRLALAVAGELAPTYPDGTWLVELGPLADPRAVPAAVAAVLEVRDEPGRALSRTLVDWLESRRRLLVLDNCEHVIEGSARLVAALLHACPNLRILATSREALRLDGELVWRVRPLKPPDALDDHAAALTPAALRDLARNPAVHLFLDRARAVQPAFSLTGDNARAVVEICRRLEGLPLALELAAARVGVLSVQQLAARLDHAIQTLSGGYRTAQPRQQTLRAALEWSERLLTPAERQLFHQLAVFAGGWTLEAAEAVCADAEIVAASVLDHLAALIDKSLVAVEADMDGARYRLLEPVRQFAWEHLAASGTAETTQGRHATYCLELAERCEPALGGPDQASWLERLEREAGNLRAALTWSVAHDGELASRLAAALARFWEVRGYLVEGRAWMERVLAAQEGPPALRAKVLSAAGTLAWRQHDYAAATKQHQASLILYRRLGDTRGIAQALNNLGAQALNQREFGRAEALLSESVTLARDLDDDIVVMALINLGLATMAGDAARSENFLTEALSVNQRLRNGYYAAVALQNLGELAYHRGDDARALALHRLSLTLAVQLQAKVHIAFSLEELAAIIARQGQAERAARLFGAAQALRAAIGSPLPLNYRAEFYDPAVAALRAALDETAHATAWAAGRALPFETAIAEAFAVTAPNSASGVSPLRAHEREIANLLAQR